MSSVYGSGGCAWSIPVKRFHECLTSVIYFHSHTAAIDKRHLCLIKVRRVHIHTRICHYLLLPQGIGRYPTWGAACCWIVSLNFDYSHRNAGKIVLTFSSVNRYCLDTCNVRSEIIWTIIQQVQEPNHAETLWGLGHSIVLARYDTFATLILLPQWMPYCQGSLHENKGLLYSTVDHFALMGPLLSRRQVDGWLHRAHIPRVRWGWW